MVSAVLVALQGWYPAMPGDDTSRQPLRSTGAQSMVDLRKATDEELYAEIERRRALRGEVGGRPAVERPCPHCGKEFGARAMRLHLPVCPKR